MQNRRSFVESCCKVNAQPRPLPSSLNNRPLNHVKRSLTQGSYIDEHTGDHMEKFGIVLVQSKANKVKQILRCDWILRKFSAWVFQLICFHESKILWLQS